MRKGSHLTEEHKRKLSEAHKGKSLSEEHKRRIGEAHKGRKLTEYQKRKLVESVRGRKITEEHRKNLSRSHMGHTAWNKGMKGFLAGKKVTWGDKISVGKKNSTKSMLASREAVKKAHEANRGMPSPKRGTTLSNEAKRKISETCKRRGLRPPLTIRLGNKSNLWRGGVSFDLYPGDWTSTLRRSIRERDDYTCQECGIRQDEAGHILHCHHIDYDKKNCNPINLITLCRSCHMKTNGNRDYWIKHFNGDAS